jgi:hypothetical protein
MRMTIVLIAALALLCGISMGMIAGLALVWHLFKPAVPRDDPALEDWGV